MDIRLLGSIFRLRRLAAEFNHFWAYAIPPETLAELWGNSANFTDFQKKLGKLCAELNEAPMGGRYLGDATLENGCLTAFFGGSNQLKISLNPDQKLLRAEYTNGNRYTCAVYDDTRGDLTWESPPQTARDAIRVLRAIASLAELDPKIFIDAHLPEELNTDEAELYRKARSWAYLLVNPSDLRDILFA